MPTKTTVLSIEGVQIKKILTEETTKNASVQYTFRSDRSDPMRVRLLELLPRSIVMAEIGFLQDDAETYWQSVNDRVLVYTRTIGPGNRVEAVFFIETAECNVYAFDRPPIVETVEPVTGRRGKHTPGRSDDNAHRYPESYPSNGLSIDCREDGFTNFSEKLSNIDRYFDSSTGENNIE